MSTSNTPWIERRSQTERLVLVALFAALTWIGAYIRLPILPDVPFTLQTLMVIMSGLFLGPRYAFYSQGLYLMMGLVGLPVFTGGTGGPSYVLQPTFGFLLGFLPEAALVGAVSRIRVLKSEFLRCLIASLLGTIALYTVATPYLYLIKKLVLKTPVPFWGLVLAMVPFMVADLLKSLVAATVVPKVMQRIISEE